MRKTFVTVAKNFFCNRNEVLLATIAVLYLSDRQIFRGSFMSLP